MTVSGTDCPKCGEESSTVRDSRPHNFKLLDVNTMRRRRECHACGHRYITFEISADAIAAYTEAQKTALVKRLLGSIAD